MIVNKLRKQEYGDKAVVKLATSLLLSWKKVMTGAPAEDKHSRSVTPPTLVSLTANELFQQYKTGDATRDKCIEMLVNALCTDTPERISVHFIFM